MSDSTSILLLHGELLLQSLPELSLSKQLHLQLRLLQLHLLLLGPSIVNRHFEQALHQIKRKKRKKCAYVYYQDEKTTGVGVPGDV